ncbi:MAG TPA: helix-turn-helix domain-containing protein [Candidatus Limnocylindrales bacterium]
MATLADLWHSVFPTAHRLGRLDPDRWSVEVAWVRSLKARVPAFDVLEPGDLALVPASALAVVASSQADLEALVDALAKARVAAVLVVGAEARDTHDPALGEALAAAGLPALRLAHGDPGQLERTIVSFLVNRRAELERQATELERQLQQLALLGRGIDVLVAAVSAFAGRPIVIENRHGDALVLHLGPEQASAAAAVARYHANPDTAALRLPLPTGEGSSTAALVLLGGEPIRERERIACDRIATLLALEISRSAGLLSGRPPGKAESLPAAGPPWVVLVARQAVGGPGAPSDITIAEREVIRGEIRLLAAPGRIVLRGDAESLELRAIAAAPPDDPGGLELAGRIAAHIGRTVAVSNRFAESTGRQVAEAEARSTLETAERLTDPPPVVSSALLPAYRLLAGLPDLPDGLRQARALLEPVLGGRPSTQQQHLQTLRAILDRDGQAEAATVLGVHRNTLAYRVRRLEQLGGWDLHDQELRLALSIAVRIVQRAQQFASEA